MLQVNFIRKGSFNFLAHFGKVRITNEDKEIIGHIKTEQAGCNSLREINVHNYVCKSSKNIYMHFNIFFSIIFKGDQKFYRN